MTTILWPRDTDEALKLGDRCALSCRMEEFVRWRTLRPFKSSCNRLYTAWTCLEVVFMTNLISTFPGSFWWLGNSSISTFAVVTLTLLLAILLLFLSCFIFDIMRSWRTLGLADCRIFRPSVSSLVGALYHWWELGPCLLTALVIYKFSQFCKNTVTRLKGVIPKVYKKAGMLGRETSQVEIPLAMLSLCLGFGRQRSWLSVRQPWLPWLVQGTGFLYPFGNWPQYQSDFDWCSFFCSAGHCL